MNTRSFFGSRRGVLAIAVWLIWYGGVLGIEAWFRSSKEPAAYTGTCQKPNGYAVPCSLEQWMEWDAAPYVGIYMLVGGVVAAALTGLMYLRQTHREK